MHMLLKSVILCFRQGLSLSSDLTVAYYSIFFSKPMIGCANAKLFSRRRNPVICNNRPSKASVDYKILIATISIMYNELSPPIF